MIKEMYAHVFMRMCTYSYMYTGTLQQGARLYAHVFMRLCTYSYMYTHMCTQVLCGRAPDCPTGHLA